MSDYIVSLYENVNEKKLDNENELYDDYSTNNDYLSYCDRCDCDGAGSWW